jgi:hypothetical protein
VPGKLPAKRMPAEEAGRTCYIYVLFKNDSLPLVITWAKSIVLFYPSNNEYLLIKE